MSNEYWARRAAKAQEILTSKSISETEKQLRRYYAAARDRIVSGFEAVSNKVLEAIGEEKVPTPADLYKLNTYWQMQVQLTDELKKLGDKQAALFSSKFMEHYKNIYSALAIDGSAIFSEIEERNAYQLIRSVWCADGKTWSARIWENTAELQQKLNNGLLENLITGKKTSDLKKTLQQDFAVSYRRADTVVRTELAHIQTQAAQDRYKGYGIEEVEVLVGIDERTCPICAEQEGKRYPIGTQLIPFHPNCRCCVIPVVNDNVFKEPDDKEATNNI